MNWPIAASRFRGKGLSQSWRQLLAARLRRATIGVLGKYVANGGFLDATAGENNTDNRQVSSAGGAMSDASGEYRLQLYPCPSVWMSCSTLELGLGFRLLVLSRRQ